MIFPLRVSIQHGHTLSQEKKTCITNNEIIKTKNKPKKNTHSVCVPWSEWKKTIQKAQFCTFWLISQLIQKRPHMELKQ